MEPRQRPASTDNCSHVLTFDLAGQSAAVPVETVERIAPMAELARPPAMPPALEGILNLAGRAVPVLRLDRLLGLDPISPGLYSMLIVLNGASAGRKEEPIALLVDRVTGVAEVNTQSLLPLPPGDSFNACATSSLLLDSRIAHLLAPERILLEKERDAIAAFRDVESRRLEDWELAQ